MARSALRDPLDKYRWSVSIDGFSKMGFHETSTPGYTLTTRKYKEGGAHLTPRKVIDSVDLKQVKLTRGATNDTSFNKWATGFMDVVTNNSTFNDASNVPTSSPITTAASLNGAAPIQSFAGTAGSAGYRKDVKIEHVNRTGTVEVIYMLYNAFPVEYSPASDFGALSDDGVSIESITLEYESFEVLYSGLAGAAANLIT